MQRAENLTLLGVFLKTHGIDGHLILKLSFLIEDELAEGEPVFVEIDGIPVPFFILEFRFLADYTALVKLDETNNTTQASEFIGCRVFSEKQLTPETGEHDIERYDKLKGFRVIDDTYGDSGILLEIIGNPENPVMRIDKDGAEILVPFHTDIVKRIDYEAGLIELSAPEGLFDLYL